MRTTVIVLILITLISTTLGAELEVHIQGIRNRKGVIQITLFDQSTGFPQDYKRGRVYRTLQNNASSLSLTFDSLSAGTYAVAVIHDKNNNKKIDAGLFGIPKEGYGVSKNIHPKTRAPRFSECSFTLKSDEKKNITITIKYP